MKVLKIVGGIAELTDEENGSALAWIAGRSEGRALWRPLNPGPREDPEILGLESFRLDRMRKHNWHTVHPAPSRTQGEVNRHG